MGKLRMLLPLQPCSWNRLWQPQKNNSILWRYWEELQGSAKKKKRPHSPHCLTHPLKDLHKFAPNALGETLEGFRTWSQSPTLVLGSMSQREHPNLLSNQLRMASLLAHPPVPLPGKPTLSPRAACAPSSPRWELSARHRRWADHWPSDQPWPFWHLHSFLLFSPLKWLVFTPASWQDKQSKNEWLQRHHSLLYAVSKTNVHTHTHANTQIIPTAASFTSCPKCPYLHFFKGPWAIKLYTKTNSKLKTGRFSMSLYFSFMCAQ